jgi:hypothetical protein
MSYLLLSVTRSIQFHAVEWPGRTRSRALLVDVLASHGFLLDGGLDEDDAAVASPVRSVTDGRRSGRDESDSAL